MEKNDNTIIDKVLEGNTDAYAVIINRYKDKVYSLVFGIIRNDTLAQEIAQDVFVKAFTGLKKFRRDAQFSTWIYRIAYNSAISETRKKKHKEHTFDEQMDRSSSLDFANTIEAEEENETRRKLLYKAINNLQADDKLILMLYYFEERTIEEISRSSGLSKSNVKVKLHRLRNRLKEMMVSMKNKELAVY